MIDPREKLVQELLKLGLDKKLSTTLALELVHLNVS